MIVSTFFVAAMALNPMPMVRFDVQPLVPAIRVASESLPHQAPQSRLVQVRLDISTIVPPEFQGTFEEAMIKLMTRQPMVQVADYWPRTEMTTTMTTPISVSESYDRDREAAIQGVGGYPGMGSAQGHAFVRDQIERDVHYQQAPPMQLLTAAGTIDRRSGVYFKLRSTPQAVLEGSRTYLITLEVPITWRGDLLEFHASAYGRKNSDGEGRRKLLGQDRFLIALYAEGDQSAGDFAMSFVHQQAKLRNLSRQLAERIQKRAYPTPIHRLGQVLDVYDPAIPDDYLEQWIFGSATDQPNSKLPVDLRVAMLDFIDSRSVVESMASQRAVVGQASIANRNGHTHMVGYR